MTFKKIASLALAALMLCSLLSACGGDPDASTPGNSASPSQSKPSSSVTPTTTVPKNENALYQVAVFDIYGQPATSGVAVKFMQNGEQAGMQIMNAEGVAELELPKGDYTVELMFVGSNVNYYYDTSDMTLSATKTQLTISLCLPQSQEGESVFVSNEEESVEYTAYPLATGNTFVTLKPGRNYFLYVPEQAGEYQMFTAAGQYKVGYYGGAHFIQANDKGKEAPNNGTAVSISVGMVSPNNSFVIGVDNPGEEDVQTTLCVLRVSDYIDTSIPKEIYKATHALTPWTKPADKTVKKFDISSAQNYQLVKDDATGFYHLGDVNGPLVVVFLGEKATDLVGYTAPYDTIIKNVNVSAYFQDENGVTVRGEIYTNCLQSYIGVYDENMKDDKGNIVGGYNGGCIDRASGLYPLTDDLMYIIQQHGEYAGWWNSNSANYLFTGVMVSKVNAWLFMCGYLE